MGLSRFEKEKKLLLEEIEREAIKRGFSIEEVMKVYKVDEISKNKSSEEVIEYCKDVRRLLTSRDPYFIPPHQEKFYGIGRKSMEDHITLRREDKWSRFI